MAESPIMKWLKQNAADLFNTVVNVSQIASSLKKKSPSGPDASPDQPSLQSDKKGRGATDEHIWLTTVAYAKSRILTAPVSEQWVSPHGKRFTRETVNARGKSLTDMLKETYPLEEREFLILVLGLEEKPTVEKIPTDKKDKNGKIIMSERVVNQNSNGILIVMSWFTMTNEQVRSEIDSIVFPTQRSQQRIDSARAKINDTLDAIQKAQANNPPGKKSSWYDLVPIYGPIRIAKENKNGKK